MFSQNSFVNDDNSNVGNSEHLEELLHFPDALEDTENSFDEFAIEDFEVGASIEHQGGDVDAATVAGLEPDRWQLGIEALVRRIQVNNDAGYSEESGGDGNNEYQEERVHLRDALGDIEQSFDGLLDGLIREDLELHAFGEQLCGSVHRLPAEDNTATAGTFKLDPLQLVKEALVNRVQVVNDARNGDNVNSVPLRDALEDTGQSCDSFIMIEDFELPSSVEQQSGKVKVLAEEDDAAMIRRLELNPVQPAAEALTSPFQAVINNFRRARMSIVEVNEILEQGRKGGIAPNPHTPSDTKVHTERMKKRRPFGIKYKRRSKITARRPRRCDVPPQYVVIPAGTASHNSFSSTAGNRDRGSQELERRRR
jgi:hypothetical protein